MDMDDGATRWLFKTARQNFWRVANWYDFDDLIQDGYLTYYRICRRYPDVKERAHIMGLFQVSFINHLHRLANLRTRASAEVTFADTNASEDTLLDKVVSNEAELLMFIAHAPGFVKQALGSLSHDPTQTPDAARELRRYLKTA